MNQQQPPKILKLLHDYRKQLSLLKVKSFYTNHLCKKNCLVGKLNSNPNQCLNKCDEWLDNFYKAKKQNYPQGAENFVFSADDVKGLSQQERQRFVKGYAQQKIRIKSYLQFLDDELNAKIFESKK